MRTCTAGPSNAGAEVALAGARGRAHLVLDGGEEAMDVLAVHAGGLTTYLGIVDILTRWSLRKKLEHALTGALRCRDVSCQPPDRYAQRMLCFLEEAISSDAPPDEVQPEAQPPARDGGTGTSTASVTPVALEPRVRSSGPRPEPNVNRLPKEVSV